MLPDSVVSPSATTKAGIQGRPQNPVASGPSRLAKDFDTLNTVPMDTIPNPPPFPPAHGRSLAKDRDAVQYILSNAVETAGFTIEGKYRLTSDAELPLFPTARSSSIPNGECVWGRAKTSTGQYRLIY